MAKRKRSKRIKMKRIIAFCLMLTILFGLFACTDTHSPNGDLDTNTGNSPGTVNPDTGGSNSGDGEEEKPEVKPEVKPEEKPVFDPTSDKLVYSPTVNQDGTWNYLDEVLNKPTFTPYYNGYKAALSMTFDDGGHYETGYNVSEVFSKYGFSGTAMLTASFINNENTIAHWNKIFALGYMDAGCHGYNHANPKELSSSEYDHEIKDAILFLRQKFPSQNVLTYASPLAQPSEPYEKYLSDYVIANRLEAMGERAYLGKSFNNYRIQAVSVNARISPPNQKYLKENIEAGAWIVELYHEVRKTGATGINCDYGTFEAHCKSLYDNYSDVLWVASFEKVAIYSKQIQNTFVEYIGATNDSMTIKAGCTIADDVYSIPMSVEVNVPSFVDSAYAIVGDQIQYLDVTVKANKKYVTVRNIDAHGQEFKIMLGGNTNCKNGCKHFYTLKERVNPTCTEIGYDINECIRCGRTYIAKYKDQYGHSYMGNPDKHICQEQNECYEEYKCRFCDYVKKIYVEKKED